MAERVYAVGGRNFTVAGATTLVFGVPSTTSGFRIRRLLASQYQSGASPASAMAEVHLFTAAAGTGTMTSSTPQLTVSDDPTAKMTGGTAMAAGTWGINASVEGAAKTIIPLGGAIHVYNGLQLVFTGRDDLIFRAGGNGFGIYLPSAPNVLTGWTISLEYEEA